MVLLKYPDLSRQEAEHQKLLEAFSQKVKEYQAGSEVVDSLLQFLMDWFVSHASLEDRKIGDHLREDNGRFALLGGYPLYSGLASGSRRKGFPKVLRTSNPGLSC